MSSLDSVTGLSLRSGRTLADPVVDPESDSGEMEDDMLR